MKPDPWEYLRVPLEPGQDRHAVAVSWELQGYQFVGYKVSPPVLIFRRKREQIEA